MRKSELMVLSIVFLSFLCGWLVYPRLPEQVASHWNMVGEVDGYVNRFWGAFLLPILLVVMFGALAIIPRIDPQRKNIQKFQKYFDGFMIVLFAFMFYLYALTLVWNLGMTFDFLRLFIPAFVVMMYSTGVLISHAEPNWSIGIRTPWTHAQPKVWKKTHELGGKLFRYSALIGLFGMVLPQFAFWFVLIPILSSTVFMVIYSYWLYRKTLK